MDPLTPDDIAEVVVFVAGRRENVVVADTLVFPSHQVSPFPCPFLFLLWGMYRIELTIYLFPKAGAGVMHRK